MKYEITIIEIGDTPEGKNYPDKCEIYSQVVEHIDIVAIINAVNNQPRLTLAQVGGIKAL